jgi:hypothetical protein
MNFPGWTGTNAGCDYCFGTAVKHEPGCYQLVRAEKRAWQERKAKGCTANPSCGKADWTCWCKTNNCPGHKCWKCGAGEV